MKKKGLFKLAACTLVLAMALSLGACSSDSKDKDSNSSKKTETEKKDNTTDNNSGKFASMDEYVASDEVQSQMDTLKASVEGQGMTVEVKGEGSKLIYTYYLEDIENQEGMAEAMEAEAERQASTFVSTAKMLKTVVDVDNPVVVIEYIDKNGEMIFTKEYASDMSLTE